MLNQLFLSWRGQGVGVGGEICRFCVGDDNVGNLREPEERMPVLLESQSCSCHHTLSSMTLW